MTVSIQTVLSLCSGIGGFELAAEMVGGFQAIAHCENNPHAQKILRFHWPEVPIINDVREISSTELIRRGIPMPDGIWGGFPCQPHSQAGKQKAEKDERDLWPEIRRIFRDLRPRWAVFENVVGLLHSDDGRFFRGILRDLAALGFDADWGVLDCASLGGVHQRDRVFIICWATTPHPHSQHGHQPNSNNSDLQARAADALKCGDRGEVIADANSSRLEGKQRQGFSGTRRLPQSAGRAGHEQIAQPPVSFGDDGIPRELARLRSRGAHLMHPEHVEEWLSAALLPTYNAKSRIEIESLAPENRAEYQRLIQAYKTLRKEQNEQITRIGNSISPQVAAIALKHLKVKLSEIYGS